LVLFFCQFPEETGKTQSPSANVLTYYHFAAEKLVYDLLFLVLPMLFFPATFGGIGFPHFPEENEEGQNNNPEHPVNPV
jgi:hypothetical protein